VAEHSTNDSLSNNEEPMRADRAPQPPAARDQKLERGPESLAGLSVGIGWGLTILGLFAAILAWLEPLPSANGATLASQLGRGARAGWLVLAFAFAGWAFFSLLRLTARLLQQRLECDARRSRELETELNRAVRLLERIAEAIERRPEAAGPEPAAKVGRANAVTEIEAAFRAEQWTLAESLLDAFEIEFPADGKSSSLRAGLHAARRNSLEERRAELAAARAVNDPARVLELYRLVAPELEHVPRRELQSEIAQWFLALIYRRLRTGKIQVDVVELATQFADSFAATTEGASVLAALPTLRRSAGLCPRCAQPYTGLDQACPVCLRPSAKVSANPGPATDAIQPE
jgi:hypothetical protein